MFGWEQDVVQLKTSVSSKSKCTISSAAACQYDAQTEGGVQHSMAAIEMFNERELDNV